MTTTEDGTWERQRARLLAGLTDAHLAVLEAERNLERRRLARTRLVREITERTPISLREVARHLDLASTSVWAWVKDLNARDEKEASRPYDDSRT